MKNQNNSQYRSGRRVFIQKPTIRDAQEEALWQQVHKFVQLIPSEVEPNLGRVREIKEEIEKGTYLQTEMIEETAARLAVRFMRKE